MIKELKKIKIKKKAVSAWENIRELRLVIELGEDAWENLEGKEVRTIRKEDKKKREEKVEEKRRKYGTRNVRKTESIGEKKLGDDKLRRKIELAEIKKNMWRLYREEDGSLVEMNKEVVEEAIQLKRKTRRKIKKKKDELKKNEAMEEEEIMREVLRMEVERERKILKAKLLKESWELMMEYIKDIERNENMRYGMVEPFEDDEEYEDDCNNDRRKRRRVVGYKMNQWIDKGGRPREGHQQQ